MNKILGSSLFFLLLVAYQAGVEAVCQRNPGYAQLLGYCYRTDLASCSGLVLKAGCYGRRCALCISDTTQCFPKPACTSHSGSCLKSANWTTCDKEIDSKFCVGTDCACCRSKVCVRDATCKNMGGYCFRKKRYAWKQHVCRGQEVPGGCGSSNCVCCTPAVTPVPRSLQELGS